MCLAQCPLVVWDWELWEFRLGRAGSPKGAAERLEPPSPRVADGCEPPCSGSVGL